MILEAFWENPVFVQFMQDNMALFVTIAIFFGLIVLSTIVLIAFTIISKIKTRKIAKG